MNISCDRDALAATMFRIGLMRKKNSARLLSNVMELSLNRAMMDFIAFCPDHMCSDDDFALQTNHWWDHSVAYYTKEILIMTNAQTLEIDPVCGMKVSSSTAIFAERDGKKYYFCGEGCRKKFLANPTGITAKNPSSGGCCG